MKWSTLLSTSSLAVAVLAGPIAKRQTPELYRLRISTDFENLNDKYLSISSDSVGVYGSGSATSATEVSTNPAGDNISLHTYPIGIVDHALGLVGSDGYLDFKDLTLPATTPKPEGVDTYSWDEFRLGEDNELLWGKDGVTPGWIASPAPKGDEEWTIKFYDSEGGAIVIQNYIPIKIKLEAVESKSTGCPAK